MVKVTKWIIGAVLGLHVFAANAEIPTIESVESRREGQSFATNMTFNQPVSIKNANVEYINQTVQIDVPNVKIQKGKKLFRIEDERVRSIYLYQVTAENLRVRIIHHKPINAVELKGHVHLSSEGNNLVIRVDNPAMAVATTLPPKIDIESTPPLDLNEEIEQAMKINRPEGVVPAEAILKAELSEGRKTASIIEKVELKVDSPQIKKNESKEAPKSAANVQTQEQELPLFKKESEIPVFKSEPQKAKVSSSQMYFRVIGSLAVVLVIGAGLAFFGRWWMKKNQKTLNNNKISVMTQHYLGPKKSLAIIRVAGEFILIGVTEHNINHIKTLSLIDDEYPADSASQFGDTLRQFSGNSMAQVPALKNDEAEEDFSFKSVKDMVTGKIKDMRSI